MAVPFVPTPRTAAQRKALAEAREHEARVQAAMPTKRRGVMNKTEAAYAAHLESWKRSGPRPIMTRSGSFTLERFDFEPERFRLADGTNYTPDFRLVMTEQLTGDIVIAFHEVKPARRLRTERDGIVRVKWAAQLNPMYRFAIVRPGGNGEWTILPVAGGNDAAAS